MAHDSDVGLVEHLGDDPFTSILDIVGIVVGTMLGAQVAIASRFDVTGTVMLALTCGLGGGVIRDILLGAGPPLALVEPTYLAAALITATTILVVDVPGSRIGSGALLAGDSLLIGFLTAAGCQRADVVGLTALSIAVLGVVTAIGGGMLRDVLVGRVPLVLQGGTLYASVAICAAATFISMDALGAGQGATTLACVLVGTLLRGAALRWRLTLPTSPQPLDPRKITRRVRKRQDHR